jgi:hypothetical protein
MQQNTDTGPGIQQADKQFTVTGKSLFKALEAYAEKSDAEIAALLGITERELMNLAETDGWRITEMILEQACLTK